MSGGDLVGRVVLERYEVLRRLAIGGQARVYLARTAGAAGFVRPFVIKQVLPEHGGDARLERKITREAKILAALRHPSIVNVVDFARFEGDLVMVLDYVHGLDLGRWSRFVLSERGVFPVDVAVHVMIEVLGALGHAHEATGPDGAPLGIVHRDISPANVLVDLEGHVKLADFGIARGSADVTDPAGALEGNFAYMAPELFERATPSVGSDLYACGVVLHEVLRGDNELARETLAATIHRVVGHTLSRLSDVRADVPAELADVVARAAHKDPDQRFTSAAQMAAALAAARARPREVVAADLRRMVTEDFRHPRLEEVLGGHSLDALERAWRTGEPAEAEADTSPDSVPPTVVARRPPAATLDAEVERSGTGTADAPAPRSPARSGTVAVAGAAVIALLAVGGGVGWRLLGTDRSDEPADEYVFVSGRTVSDAGPRPRDAGALDAGGGAGLEAAPARDRADRGADELARAFALRRPALQRCFATHAAELEGAPDLALRFHVDGAGVVERAEVLPPAVARTALGACVAEVARGTRFGPQPGPAVFRIPIGVQRVR